MARRTAALSRLRSEVQTIKISKGSYKFALATEIRILKLLQPYKHASIMSITDSGEGDRWYTMPAYTGGCLYDLIPPEGSSNLPALPGAFVWHIGLRLVGALLFLHYGMDEFANQLPDWPWIVHDDIHRGNLFLDMSGGEGSFGNYPNIVLGDFGNAMVLREEENTKQARSTYFERQLKDLTNLISILKLFAPSINGQTYLAAVEKLETFDWKEQNVEYCYPGREVLCQFIEEAYSKRRDLYAPLPAEVLNHLKGRVLCDSDLDHILYRLGQATLYFCTMMNVTDWNQTSAKD